MRVFKSSPGVAAGLGLAVFASLATASELSVRVGQPLGQKGKNRLPSNRR
ncbi:uncharacterized protein METZ01_LOCUS263261, partial [marine metagenome]